MASKASAGLRIEIARLPVRRQAVPMRKAHNPDSSPGGPGGQPPGFSSGSRALRAPGIRSERVGSMGLSPFLWSFVELPRAEQDHAICGVPGLWGSRSVMDSRFSPRQARRGIVVNSIESEEVASSGSRKTMVSRWCFESSFLRSTHVFSSRPPALPFPLLQMNGNGTIKPPTLRPLRARSPVGACLRLRRHNSRVPGQLWGPRPSSGHAMSSSAG
jgi:hypothetical protein